MNSLSKSTSLGESSLDSDPLRESRRSSLDSQASVIQSAITEVEFQSENVINLIINIDRHYSLFNLTLYYNYNTFKIYYYIISNHLLTLNLNCEHIEYRQQIHTL